MPRQASILLALGFLVAGGGGLALAVLSTSWWAWMLSLFLLEPFGLACLVALAVRDRSDFVNRFLRGDTPTGTWVLRLLLLWGGLIGVNLLAIELFQGLKRRSPAELLVVSPEGLFAFPFIALGAIALLAMSRGRVVRLIALVAGPPAVAVVWIAVLRPIQPDLGYLFPSLFQLVYVVGVLPLYYVVLVVVAISRRRRRVSRGAPEALGD